MSAASPSKMRQQPELSSSIKAKSAQSVHPLKSFFPRERSTHRESLCTQVLEIGLSSVVSVSQLSRIVQASARISRIIRSSEAQCGRATSRSQDATIAQKQIF